MLFLLACTPSTPTVTLAPEFPTTLDDLTVTIDADDGYRLLVNCGEHANQEVLHLHMHLVGGVQLGRMLSQQTRNPT